MKRRDFIGKLSIGALLGGGLSACDEAPSQSASQSVPGRHSEPVRQWKMVTTWPKNFPVIGTGAERFAELIGAMSGGSLQVKVYAAGELVPPFECFDAVSQGAVQMGHGAAYYWKGKSPAFQFFSSVPFGMNALQMNAWLHAGDGLKLWREVYEPFGVLPLPSGNTGMQMAGWFNREIRGLDDLQGLKMRIPGLGGEVLKRAGVTVVTLPGGELLTAMQTGVIDAVEWVNPYSDLAFGLHKVAKFYYYPAWHEPSAALECIINRSAWDELPTHLQQVIEAAARAVNYQILEEFVVYNGQVIQDLQEKHKVKLRRLPDEVLERLRVLSAQVVGELAEADEMSGKIYSSYTEFKKRTQSWYDISEKMYYQILSES